MAAKATEIAFEAGRTIVRQGEVGTGFFLIASGQARVIRDGRTIAELGPGQFFGELSLLDQQPRIANVVAEYATSTAWPSRPGTSRPSSRRSRASPWRSCAESPGASGP